MLGAQVRYIYVVKFFVLVSRGLTWTVTEASSAETTKTPLNTSVPESTVVVADYIQIRCESVNVIFNAISRLLGKLWAALSVSWFCLRQSNALLTTQCLTRSFILYKAVNNRKVRPSCLTFFKVKVKQKLHWNMFRTMNCILSLLRENRCAVGRMPCFYFQTRPCASSVIYMHGYVRFFNRVNKLQWLS